MTRKLIKANSKAKPLKKGSASAAPVKQGITIEHQGSKPKTEEKTQERPKDKTAVGLKYDGKEAPTVVAKGFGDLADEIIALAKDSGVLVHEDPYLSELLARMDLGQEIPDSLYYVIAELIAFSYVLQGKTPEGWKAKPGQLRTEV